MGTIQIRPSSRVKRIFPALLCLILAIAPTLAAAVAQQDIGTIRKAVESFVHLNTTGLPGNVALSVGTIDPRLQLPACNPPEVFLPTGSRLWGNTTVGVRCQSATPWTIYVPVSVKIMTQIAVAARPLSAGQTISPSDITLQDGDLSQLPSSVILDPTQIVGKTLVSGATSGQSFRPDMLRAAQVIQQGQAVKVVAKGNGFQVSAEGKALANANLGQVVQVRTQAGQIISGIAKQNGVVEVNF
jgi:flagella basal body P-ring formation protein FlgA